MKSYITYIILLSILLYSCKEELKKAEDSNLFPYYEDVGGIFDKDIKVGYMDSHGKKVIPPLFHEGELFKEGLAKVTFKRFDGEKHGFIDSSGSLVIPATLDRARSFQNSRSWAYEYSSDSNHTGYGLINKKGKYISPRVFESGSIGFTDDYYFGSIYKKSIDPSFFDIAMTGIFSLGFDQATPTRLYDTYRISVNGDTTLISKNTPEYFTNELINEETVNKINYLSTYRSGEYCGYKKHLFTPTAALNYDDCNSLRQINDGFIAIDAQFKSCDCFEGKYAKVTLMSGKSAYINTKGKVLFTFEDDFSEMSFSRRH